MDPSGATLWGNRIQGSQSIGTFHDCNPLSAASTNPLIHDINPVPVASTAPFHETKSFLVASTAPFYSSAAEGGGTIKCTKGSSWKKGSKWCPHYEETESKVVTNFTCSGHGGPHGILKNNVLFCLTSRLPYPKVSFVIK
jgi:hypothetical protein